MSFKLIVQFYVEFRLLTFNCVCVTVFMIVLI